MRRDLPRDPGGARAHLGQRVCSCIACVAHMHPACIDMGEVPVSGDPDWQVNKIEQELLHGPDWFGLLESSSLLGRNASGLRCRTGTAATTPHPLAVER